MLFGGEGGFIVHCTGQGKVIAGSFGALDLIELPPGAGIHHRHRSPGRL